MSLITIFHHLVPAVVVLICGVLFFSGTGAERVSIQAGKSFCFFEDLKANQPWGVQFQADEQKIKAVVHINNLMMKLHSTSL